MILREKKTFCPKKENLDPNHDVNNVKRNTLNYFTVVASITHFSGKTPTRNENF